MMRSTTWDRSEQQGQATPRGHGQKHRESAQRLAGWLRELLAAARRDLEHLYGPRLRGLYLFGSQARGDAETGSDVDLLIVLDQVPHYAGEVQRTSQITADLALQYDLSVSTVFVSDSDWLQGGGPFLVNVRQDAIAA